MVAAKILLLKDAQCDNPVHNVEHLHYKILANGKLLTSVFLPLFVGISSSDFLLREVSQF